MLFLYLDMFSCKVPSFSEPCDLLWETEVYVETHLRIFGVCDKRKIPTVTNEVFCSFLQDSAGVRLTQVAVCFFCIPLFSINWNLKTVGRVSYSDLQKAKVTVVGGDPWVPAGVSIVSWTVLCCSCNLTLRLLVNSNPDISCRRARSFSGQAATPLLRFSGFSFWSPGCLSAFQASRPSSLTTLCSLLFSVAQLFLRSCFAPACCLGTSDSSRASSLSIKQPCVAAGGSEMRCQELWVRLVLDAGSSREISLIWDLTKRAFEFFSLGSIKKQLVPFDVNIFASTSSHHICSI